MEQTDIDAIHLGDPLPAEVLAAGKATLSSGAYNTVGLLVRFPVRDGGKACGDHFARVLLKSDRAGKLEFAYMCDGDYEHPSGEVQDGGGVWIILNTPEDFALGSDTIEKMLYLAIYISQENKGRKEKGLPLLTHPDMHVRTYRADPKYQPSEDPLQLRLNQLPTAHSLYHDGRFYTRDPTLPFQGPGRKRARVEGDFSEEEEGEEEEEEEK